MIDATAAFSPFALTTVVADDTVNMVEWWAARGVETPISGDDLAQARKERGLKAGHLLAWAVCNRAIEHDYYRATTLTGRVEYFHWRSPAEEFAGTRGTIEFIEAGVSES